MGLFCRLKLDVDREVLADAINRNAIGKDSNHVAHLRRGYCSTDRTQSSIQNLTTPPGGSLLQSH